ncbi:MAG: hypothetical protein IPM22_15350 [Betaproteobacteria bacterium]|nr:hypothetical protein [Betaproteobacteria bacterium]MCC7218695.1 hypothetical protein [Burkholderiales bacterium]
MTLQSLDRWKAFGLHLAISALIAATVVMLVVWLWYPRPYFEAMGGEVLLRLLIGVDVVVGPLITLLIFDPKKPRLKYDLATIAVLQIAALAYGGFVMFEARPVYNVYFDGRFHTVPAYSVDAASRARAAPEFRPLSLTGPRVVAAMLPADPRETVGITVAAAMGGPDLPDLPHLYVPYTQAAAKAASVARPLVSLAQRGRAEADAVNDFVNVHGTGRVMGYVPVRARNRDFAAVVDRKTGEVIGYLPIVP